ncbi:MAG: class I SAM-dependent methyltransferase [Lachnospiraceae bacterium]|nr:class I SAM-dependent methyltransferase [Lachnospiraceae bacterium]
MEAYTEFSKWYDELMEDVPYDEWFDFVSGKLSEYGIDEGLLCELGAGTGNFTMRLAKAGFDMIGIDNSEEMLSVARAKKEEYEKKGKAEENNEDDGNADLDNDAEESVKSDSDKEDTGKVSDIMYICQDMREFELYGTVNAIISVCDSINYILEDEEIIHTFKLVNNYLDPKGLFIFDFNTEHKYRDVIGDSTIADSSEDVSFIWSNYYDEESNINEYEVTFFVKTEVENSKETLYRKFEEYHYQRGYTLEEMKEFIDKAGMVFLDAFDADGFGSVSEKSERVFVIAMEKGK